MTLTSRPSRPPVTAVLADEQPLILAGLRATLAAHRDIEIVGEARDPDGLLAIVERRAPDVALMDLRGSDGAGRRVIATIAERHPDTKTVVLSTATDRESVDAALHAGAAAYVLKTAEPADVTAVVRQAANGAVFHAPASSAPATPTDGLTDRERSILTAVASSKTTPAIAREMYISEHTIKFHLTNIYRKLGVPNRAGAVRYALQHGLG